MALSVAQDMLSEAYARSDSSEAASVCAALAAAASNVGFTYGEAQSVGYTFKASTVAFIPRALGYTLQFSDGAQIYLSTGVVVVATPYAGMAHYTTIYPEGAQNPAAPSVGPSGSVVWSIQEPWPQGPAEYVYALVFTLPKLVDTGMNVGGLEVWRLYFINLVGAGGVESFSNSGYVTLSAQVQQVYAYSGVSWLSIGFSSQTPAYPTGFFNVGASKLEFDGQVVVQVVVANVSVYGTRA